MDVSILDASEEGNVGRFFNVRIFYLIIFNS